MILFYIILSYLLFIGMTIAVLEDNSEYDKFHIFVVGIFAPILVPILIGYEIQRNCFKGEKVVEE